ncbi:cytochrome P450 [Pisolithus orientalis]|uniref:cytochrome P450 n=1 Tax=Pisolithus orientalis TaxID=936130 RepID=UPI00222550CF|nr:cytochrome P450 [Pisolithus orientalis]KAI5986036.1 cytochrome P450 [Pisolithus orientalis]
MDTTSIVFRLTTIVRSLKVLDIAVAVAGVLAFHVAVGETRRRFKTTQLRGPPVSSFIFGAGKDVLDSPDSGEVYEAWAQEYGVAYEVPLALGKKKIILCDPKAIAHFFAGDTSTYGHTALDKVTLERSVGKGILWAMGENHRRQRRSMSPAFTYASIGKLTPVFYNCVYKVKAGWDEIIDANDEDSAIIEVAQWMNHLSLDSVGLAGFSHDFGALDGKKAPVTQVFEAFQDSSKRNDMSSGVFLLLQVFPALVYIPSPRMRLVRELHYAMVDVCNAMLDKTKKEKEAGALAGREKSIIEVLVQAEGTDSAFYATREEALGSGNLMKALLIAAYESSAINLVWALVELARNPDVQTTLREELLACRADPTYEQLNKGLPYLDAVAHETLRLHPSIPDFERIAEKDDVIPLSEPVHTKAGEVLDSIRVAAGTLVAISTPSVNRSAAIWGIDAKEFRPERWIDKDGITKKAQEIQGHRHLLSFGDGPRMCIGKGIALTMFKVVLSVLMKNYVLEMRDGPNTKIEMGRALSVRPKVAGEQGARLPLRVRRYEG